MRSLYLVLLNFDQNIIGTIFVDNQSPNTWGVFHSETIMSGIITILDSYLVLKNIIL